MTFIYGTNAELLYSMPAIGATLAATAKTCISGTSSTNGAFQLPALQNIWSPGSMVGRGLMFLAQGGYDIVQGNSNIISLSLDTTVGTAGAVVVAQTGAAVWPGSVIGNWQFQAWLTCVGAGTASTWYGAGTLTCGPGSAATSTAATYMLNTATAAGIPTTLTIPTTTAYYPELYSQWTTAPTAMVCSQFLVFGLN